MATGSSAPSASAEQAYTGDDGLTVTVDRDWVTQGGSEGFVVTVADANTSGVDFDSYKLSGIPAGWQVSVDGTALAPVSPDPVIFEIPKSATSFVLTPAADYVGTLSDLKLSRVSKAGNLVTDFDNGTFDYIGQSHPTITTNPVDSLSSGSTPYTYHDPQTVVSSCGSAQYAPCDGQYSIWSTADINGPALGDSGIPGWPYPRAYNNYWADLRSTTNAMTDPTTDTVTQGWDTGGANTLASNTYSVPSPQAAAAGKFLIVNGSRSFPQPHDVITTTITGLEPNTDYTMSGFIANVSSQP